MALPGRQGLQTRKSATQQAGSLRYGLGVNYATIDWRRGVQWALLTPLARGQLCSCECSLRSDLTATGLPLKCSCVAVITVHAIVWWVDSPVKEVKIVGIRSADA